MFFTNTSILGLILLLASFLDPFIGLSGAICVIVTMAVAHLTGFDRSFIRNGIYTYNSLLVGLSLAVYFQFSFNFFILLIFASVITLFLTLWMATITARFGLPFLSLPFILSVWILVLNIRNFDISFIQVRGFTLVSPDPFHFPGLIDMYFRSMGNIVFQTNIMAGVLVTIGLLIYSRIAFSLSVIGFLCGYIFFKTLYGNYPETDFLYTSFNYIFSAVALGGFVFIPSMASYILVIASTPVTGFMATALYKLTGPFNLPLFSLPFTFSTLLLLSGLNKRLIAKYLHVVQYQLYSPEKNLYAHHTYLERFKNNFFIQIHLPFFGEWFISQAHNGKITHKKDWQYAWDFVVTDENKHTFRLPGKQLEDFYCYSLPVLSPGDGTVVTILDDVDDNNIGDVNISENWGNTIIIKHTELLYSKISHIKKNSFKVKVGDHVKKGSVLALCGNSGRSPEPHIHFQLQASAYIGAKTLKYPLSYYISQKNGRSNLNSFAYPEEGEIISRPVPTALLSEAFHFVPGMKLEFDVTGNSEKTEKTNWEVFTDAYNQTYIYCHNSRSIAYFVNNDTLFYFTGFSGDKRSSLYYFYLAAYKVLLSYIKDISIEDTLPVEGNFKNPSKLIQDIIAPFYIFIKPTYRSSFMDTDNIHHPAKIKISSEVINGNGSKNKIIFNIDIAENKIKTLEIHKNTH